MLAKSNENKVNIWAQVVLLQILQSDNEVVEKESRKTLSFTIVSKW